ncbi:hypothetical protein KGF57_001287 [Candida theae]|uniref:Xylanolytic transcriptional activator regulatory domain-containing protein n=1 Tax=Candida theae TaxID=1198502 RepID=A0AAD5G032_9ASCO|nr:uncharacterized protein KGF57_001287 [Candida theae]KAI5963409.1 hypothetical protein KGF57_001287 [Candida theae]
METKDASRSKFKEGGESAGTTGASAFNSNSLPTVPNGDPMSGYAPSNNSVNSTDNAQVETHKSNADANETLNLKRRVQELEKQLRAEQLSKWNRTNSITAPTLQRTGTLLPGHINFNYSFTDDEPLPLSNRPFPFMLSMRREGGSKLLYNLLARDGKRDGHLFTSSLMLSELDPSRSNMLKEKARISLGDFYIPCPGDSTLNTEELKRKIALNHFGLTFVTPQVDLRDPIAGYFSLIPPAWVCKKLLDIFFKELYVLIPIIDEQDFRAALSRILGPQLEENYINTFPNVDSADDLAILVMHLIILRISYLSLLDLHGNSRSLLVRYPVTFDAFRAADTIMKEFDFSCSQSLTVLQAGIIIRTYAIVAPEAQLTGRVAQVKQGTITELCYALSLNRDPSCFPEQSPKMQNLRRKIWHYVARMDISSSVIYGTVLSTDAHTYDCQLPRFSVESANCYDLNIEQQIIESFRRSYDVFQIGRKLAEYHLLASETFPIEQVIKVLDNLETSLTDTCGNVKPLLSKQVENISSVTTMLVYVQMKLFMAYTYYCIHLYYESQSNQHLSSKYFLKTTSILLQDLGDLNMFVFQPNSSLNLQTTGRLTEFYLHLSLMIFTGIRLRLKCYMRIKFPARETTERDLEHEILYQLEENLKLYTHEQAIKLGYLASKFRYSLMLRGIHMITIKLCDQFQYLCDANTGQAIKDAAIKLPLDVLQKFGQKLDIYKLPKTNELFDFSDEGLIAEMNRQNFWDQFNVIENEETVTSAWIEKTKKFNRFADEMRLGFNYNLGFDLPTHELNLFSS